MKVITVSRNFPSYHPKSGSPTYFVEKIYNKIWNEIEYDGFEGCGVFDLLKFLNPEKEESLLEKINDSFDPEIKDQKLHTIRDGKRWKDGDEASLRFWSGMPYRSKQIEFARVKLNVYNIEIKNWKFSINGSSFRNPNMCDPNILEQNNIRQLAFNDGLTNKELFEWFRLPCDFSGQILSWSGKLY